MTILSEESVTTCRDGVWRMRVRHDRLLLPRRVDGRWRLFTPVYVLEMAPPAYPDQWKTVERTSNAATREGWTAR